MTNIPASGRWMLSGRARLPGALALFCLVALVLLGRGDRVGDGTEYYAMMFNLAEFHRPFSDPASWEFYDEYALANRDLGFAPRQAIWSKYDIFLTRGDQNDFPHFWFFSLLATPFYKILNIFGIHPAYSFTALNLSLFLLVAGLIYILDRFTGLFAFLILVCGSPAWWFLNKAHTEFFTFVGLTFVVAAVAHRKYFAGSLALSVLSTQNPPFAIAAVALLGISVACNRLRLTKQELVSSALTIFFTALHPVYYLWRLEVPTPQLLRGISSEPITFNKASCWLIDPDIGLLPNWPLGVILLVAFLITWVQTGQALSLRRAARPTLLTVAFLALLVVAHSRTTNVNSGGTLHVARYAIWYLPLWYPVTTKVLKRSLRWTLSIKIPLSILLAVFLSVNMWIFLPLRKETYTAPTRFSRWIYGNFPHFYDPYPEIFLERYSGLGQRVLMAEPWAVAHPLGRKILLVRENVLLEEFNGPRRVLGNGVPIDPSWLAVRARPIVRQSSGKSFTFMNLGVREVQNLLPSYQLGTTTDFARPEARRFLGEGWSRTEVWGVWTEASMATLGFELVNPPRIDTTELTLLYRPWLDGYGVQDVRVLLNGVTIGRIRTEKSGVQEFQATFSSDLMKRENILKLHFGRLTSPKEMGLSGDPRRLGIGIQTLRIESRDEAVRVEAK